MKHLGRATRSAATSGRWLGFELLERRDLLAVIRLVDWNTENHPNNALAGVDFQTILQEIGNETVQGTTKRIDILALQETDTTGGGGSSIGRIENILDTLYPSTNYSSVVSTVDGGGDATGFVYDTSSVSLLSSIEVPGTLTHKILRGQFRPSGTLGESDLFLYSIHLKSGDSGSDATTRGMEASVLRADANARGEGTHVLFVGDFNMKTSSEAAYVNLVSAGAGQVQDVAGQPGNWFDNALFKSLHSQDPGTTMDDRFDIQFVSGEFFNGTGLEYVANSFHVFGNNGTHTFDQPITTGTGASPAVLTALASVSDHLPVAADYVLLGSAPGVVITESGGSTTVIEGGSGDTYNIVLNTVPAANVTVTVTPDSEVDVGNGAGLPKVLTFTPGDALLPQTVTVTAVDDTEVEGTHAATILHSAASSDSAYSGIVIGKVVANVLDNDFGAPPQIVITELMYNPASDETAPGIAEWFEIVNAGTSAVDLGKWKFDDGDPGSWGDIPVGTVLNPGQIAVIFDSAFASAETFGMAWAVPDSALVVPVLWAGMANDPNASDEIHLLDNSGVERDYVPYDRSTPWPSISPMPGGPSIYLKNLSLDNSNGANWGLSATGVAGTVLPTYSLVDKGSPGRFFLPGDYDVNGFVDAGDYVLWRDTLGSNSDLRADGSGPTFGLPNMVVDQADYDFWRANYGQIGAYFSGGLPAAGAGGIVDGTAVSQSLVASPSEPTQTSSADDALAVDAAVVDMALIPSPPQPAVAAKPVSRLGSPSSVAAAADLLLVVDRSYASPRRAVDADAAFTESSENDVTGVDEFFASLADWEAGVLAERS